MLNLKKFREVNVSRCVKAFKHNLHSWSVAEWTNALAGEAGEACNIAKKMIRLRDKVAGNKAGMTYNDYKKMLRQELADIVIYADLTAAREGIDLEEAIIETFNNKSDELGSDIKYVV